MMMSIRPKIIAPIVVELCEGVSYLLRSCDPVNNHVGELQQKMGKIIEVLYLLSLSSHDVLFLSV